ncbi:MAG TPA: CHAT domain-containing protein, partial [Gammaproteobacteria bacterium]|nr:CHAT domain-containing protein [Gammaproteobacteria bacterium]
NTVLAEKNQPERFTRLEIIEIYEDQAILAVRALRRLGGDSSISGKLDLSEADTLQAERGGRRRITFDDPPGWWDRIQILSDVTDRRTAELRFLTLTRRARNELRTVATQTALVDAMIDASIRSTRYDADLARALYERLVPNEVKDQVSQRDNLMLMVDETAARFPWELMEDAYSSSARPLSVEHGVLRQLATSIMRERPMLVGAARALVIGDPVSGFPELPGAQAEAREVCGRLESNGFEVHKCLRSGSGEVVQQLYARVYKVLHLAGHGVYNYLPEEDTHCDECGRGLSVAEIEERERSPAAVTGMVIGDGLFLTPAEVKQMRQVPELVFINCCHLGRIEEGGGSARFNLLAANLATEFIRMGVRAVVAAGWAVDDGAARIFAGRFYQSLLEGEAFGDAVREARKAAFLARPGSNTWGAYQCYGDPGFTLVSSLTPAGGAAKTLHFASVNELVNAIENIQATLKDKGGRDVSAELGWLDRYEQYARDKGWNRAGDGRIGLALARAYGEAEAFDKAVDHLDDARRNAAASMTLRDQEQLPNLR